MSEAIWILGCLISLLAEYTRLWALKNTWQTKRLEPQNFGLVTLLFTQSLDLCKISVIKFNTSRVEASANLT